MSFKTTKTVGLALALALVSTASMAQNGPGMGMMTSYCYQYPAKIDGPTSSTDNVCAYYLLETHKGANASAECAKGWTWADRRSVAVRCDFKK
jgi:hypothetical protein